MMSQNHESSGQQVEIMRKSGQDFGAQPRHEDAVQAVYVA
jgi:hypothetical protein